MYNLADELRMASDGWAFIGKDLWRTIASVEVLLAVTRSVSRGNAAFSYLYLALEDESAVARLWLAVTDPGDTTLVAGQEFPCAITRSRNFTNSGSPEELHFVGVTPNLEENGLPYSLTGSIRPDQEGVALPISIHRWSNVRAVPPVYYALRDVVCSVLGKEWDYPADA